MTSSSENTSPIRSQMPGASADSAKPSQISNGIKKLLKKIIVKNELNLLLQASEEVKKNIYRSAPGKVEEILKPLLPERLIGSLADATAPYMREGKPSDFTEFIKILKAEFGKLRVLRIYIALEPSEKLLESIKSWLEEKAGEDIILEVEVDRQILGGARLVFEGKFREITLARLIDSFFKEEREEILYALKG